MNQTEITDLIYFAAASHAAGKGYRLGDGADSFFRHHANIAAAQLAKEQDSTDMLKLAVKNSHKLVNAMIVERSNAYRNDPKLLASNIIGELTLSAALAKLCPIFPFCK